MHNVPPRDSACPHADFARGLMAPRQPVPADVVAHAGRDVTDRYNVYRNNVMASLVDALAAIYPATQRITGVDFFRAMARFHVRACPPRSPLLFEYGRDFPAFVESYEYARDMPWLADTARIERAWLDAYHAADAPVLDAGAIAAIEPADLPDIRFRPHPAARIVQSRFPAVAIFTMNKRDGDVTPICSDEAEDALVTRPGYEVLVSRLPAGGAAFLSSLMSGAPLAAAAADAYGQASDFDLQGNLGGMLACGVFTCLAYKE